MSCDHSQEASCCPICGGRGSWSMPSRISEDTRAILAAAGKAEPSTWRLCRTCANAYPTRQPDPAVLAAIWAKARLDEDADPAEAERRRRYRIEVSQAGAERATRIYGALASRPDGRFLDVGCGLGETVRAFAAQGWDALGIDPDPSVADYHRSIGIRSVTGQVETIALEGPFDIIHCSHAIYFVSEPRRFLDRVRGLLAEDGLFCVTLADFTHWLSPNLPGYPHTFFPTPASMRAGLALAGFRTIAQRNLKTSTYLAARKSEPHRAPVSPVWHWLHWHTLRARYALVGAPAAACYRLLKVQ